MGADGEDFTVAGSGTTSGGVYNNVRIMGSGHVRGDLDCKQFSVSGSCRIDGNVKAEKASIAGSAHVEGDMLVETVKISGTLHIDGALNGGEIKVSGSSDLGSIKVDRLKLSGSIKVSGDVSADAIEADGYFKVGGMMNADTMDIRLMRLSTANELGGGTISVKREERFHHLLFSIGMLAGDFIFESDVIEGDDVYLEYVKANVVRGGKVKLGRGCKIGLVEYTEDFTNDGSDVKESRKA